MTHRRQPKEKVPGTCWARWFLAPFVGENSAAGNDRVLEVQRMLGPTPVCGASTSGGSGPSLASGWQVKYAEVCRYYASASRQSVQPDFRSAAHSRQTSYAGPVRSRDAGYPLYQHVDGRSTRDSQRCPDLPSQPGEPRRQLEHVGNISMGKQYIFTIANLTRKHGPRRCSRRSGWRSIRAPRSACSVATEPARARCCGSWRAKTSSSMAKHG